MMMCSARAVRGGLTQGGRSRRQSDDGEQLRRARYETTYGRVRQAADQWLGVIGADLNERTETARRPFSIPSRPALNSPVFGSGLRWS